MNKKSISAVLLMGAIVVTSINGCLVKSNANEKSDSNDNFKTIYNKNENIEESNNYVLLTKSNEDYIILNKRDNTEITNVHETVDGVTVKLTAYEALDRLNNNQQIDDTSINESEVEEKETKSTKTFQRTGTSSVTGSARDLSHDVDGGTKGASISLSKGINVGVSNTFSTSISSEQKLIQAGAGFSWNTSATRTLVTTHNVSAGKIGRVKFKPYYKRVSGKLHTVMTSGVISATKNVYGDSPKKISTGLCDGLEYLEQRNR